MQIEKTNAKNKDFIALVEQLDSELAIRDGDDHAFYDQFNKIDMIKYAVVLYDNGEAIACGSIKEFDNATVEVKRMYTIPKERGKGVASMVLNKLEEWAKDLSYQRCILETGINQPEAIALYNKCGYSRIENYGQYKDVESSFCFEKKI